MTRLGVIVFSNILLYFHYFTVYLKRSVMGNSLNNNKVSYIIIIQIRLTIPIFSNEKCLNIIKYDIVYINMKKNH